jgi:hypothetical protein
MQLPFLTPERALIFRITHIANVPWILEHGLHCRNSNDCDPNFREIGNPDLIGKRGHRVVPVAPGGTLSDYVPFYFTPLTPMLLNIKTGYNGMRRTPMPEIVMFVASVRRLAELGVPFVLTDRHAYLQAALYSNDLQGLERIDWGILQARDFKRADNDPGKIERYQAEALVHHHAPLGALAGLVCYGPAQKVELEAEMDRRGLSLKVAVRPGWYF